MKYRAFFFAFILFSSATIAQENNFKIIGSTPKDVSTNIYLFVNGDTLQTKVFNKQFVFEGHIDAPMRVLMKTDGNCGSKFFIEPGEMTMTTTISEDPREICIFKKELKGSATQNVYEKFVAEMEKIRVAYTGEQRKKKQMQIVTRIVAENPSSLASTFLVDQYSKSFGYEWAKANYTLLSDDQKSSWEGKSILKFITSSEILKIGNTITDFTQKDIHDTLFQLSSLKGKYVLIDFWASWCAPCRKENPKVKKVYEKYHSKGFEIVGVSLDYDAAKWKEAVKKDGLNWIHISDLKGWENELASAFQINSVPFNILLDKQGKIVATDLRSTQLENALLKLINNKD